MTETVADLYTRMEAAAARADYEEAARLRDRISLIRSAGGTPVDMNFDPTGLTRQAPGKMGLGTSQQRVSAPKGWTPPAKPDPMTTGQARPRGRRKGQASHDD
ncbi:MAG: UvrB/UvrC motif-containing protein [Pseudomonadota bacterium]